MTLPSDAGPVEDAEDAEEPATGPVRTAASPVDPRSLTLLDRLGGPWGLLGTGAPQVVFAVVTNFASLPVTAGVSLTVAVVLGVIRKARGAATSDALGGVLGVGIASGISIWTGSASDFFLVGIVTSLVCFAGTAASLGARRAVTGLAWNAVHGGGHPWRDDRPSRLAHDVATGTAAVMFGIRAAVSLWLYVLDSTGGLAIARVALGLPLTAVTAVVVLWAFRRSTTRLITPRRVAEERARAAARRAP